MDKNSSGSIFAIGDIHGQHEKLVRLLARLPYDCRRDTLVFLGDYIDRGPESPRVIDTILSLQKRAKVVALLGNHEHLLLQYHRTGDEALLQLLRKLHIEATVEEYGRNSLSGLRDLSFLPSAHRRFLEGLLPTWETEDFIFVHAGLQSGISLAEQDIESLTSIRDTFLISEEGFAKRVIFGHTTFATPLVTPVKIGIDTGAGFGGLLTGVELPALQFYHA